MMTRNYNNYDVGGGGGGDGGRGEMYVVITTPIANQKVPKGVS